MTPRLLAIGLGAACVEVPPEPGLATEIISAPGHTGEGFFDAERAVNGVRGAGAAAGSVDVFSITLDGPGDALVLGFDGLRLFDTPGVDLIIFENAFEVASGGRFLDPTRVELSPDGEAWTTVPHGFVGGDLDDPDAWYGVAGLEPVFVHEDDAPMAYDDEDAGGDRFDLAALDLDDPVAQRVLDEGVLQVRLSAAEGPRHPISNGPDIDGVWGAALR